MILWVLKYWRLLEVWRCCQMLLVITLRCSFYILGLMLIRFCEGHFMQEAPGFHTFVYLVVSCKKKKERYCINLQIFIPGQFCSL